MNLSLSLFYFLVFKSSLLFQDSFFTLALESDFFNNTTNFLDFNLMQINQIREDNEDDLSKYNLEKWSSRHQPSFATNEQGFPAPSLTATVGIDPDGPLLLQDLNFQDHLAHFASERIPERVVHSKGAGAFGYFEVTNPEVSKYTGASLFSELGLKTPVAVRLSSVVGELGSADSVNDLRGFAVKFYTADGNYDLLMLNTKTYNLRDPILFPSVTRSRKRNPSTHLFDYDSYWDFTSLRPETTFSTFLVFTDLGFPKNYRHMSGFGINTFGWTGGTCGEDVFVRYSMIPNNDREISDSETYTKMAGEDPDSFIRDLYNAIEAKEFPTWTLYVQIVKMDQVKDLKFNPFDATKILPLKDFPLVPVGQLVLDTNPVDYFNQIEQLAFHPGNLVPGIQVSPDRVLHGRIFTYGVTQRHRLGKNYNQIPVNCPRNMNKVKTYTRDGHFNLYTNDDGGPNYFPNSFNGPSILAQPIQQGNLFSTVSGNIGRFDTGEEDNYAQVDYYWREEMDESERVRTIRTIARHLSKASPRIINQSLERNWDPINQDISQRLRNELREIQYQQ